MSSRGPGRTPGRRGVRLLIAAVPLVACMAMLALKAWNPGAYAGMVAEDGPVEYAQALAYLTCAAIGMGLAVGRARSLGVGLGGDAWSLAYLAVALGGLFVLGEEISWGQRLLGLQPSDWFLRRNLQYEITLHNLDVVRPWVHKVFVAVGAVGSFAWIGCRLTGADCARRLGVPPDWWLGTWFWPVLAFYFVWGLGAWVELGPLARDAFLTVRDQEVAELWLALGITAAVLRHARLTGGLAPGRMRGAPEPRALRSPYGVAPVFVRVTSASPAGAAARRERK